jgi:hypothetical protein
MQFVAMNAFAEVIFYPIFQASHELKLVLFSKFDQKKPCPLEADRVA